jgi:phospholipid-binding lipoprotein MlaA
MPARILALTVSLLAAAVLSGCAGRQPPQPDYDPWERLNRKTFWFNEKLDAYALEPVARGWDYITPDPVQKAISRFFNNLLFPVVFVNNILQRKPRGAIESLARFQTNTFLGGLGFYDLAADFGLPLQVEDTAQTLGVWGISPGPYLVLPFFGPSNPRDTVGLAGDFALGFYVYFVPIPVVTVAASAVNIVNERSRYLDEVSNMREASLDFYTAVRNAYVQRRWKLQNDAISGESSVYDEDELYNEEIYEDYLEQGDEQ